MEIEIDDCPLVFREYGVVKKILSFLSAKELQSIKLVCKLWHTIANRLISQRTQIYYSFVPSLEPEDLEFESLDNVSLRETIESLWSKPSLCIAFVTADETTKPTHEDISAFDAWQRDLLKTYQPEELKWKIGCGNYTDTFNSLHLRKYLPRSCELVGVFSESVIGTSPENNERNTKMHTAEIDEGSEATKKPDVSFLTTREEFPGAGFYCIPYRPGVSFRLFHFDQKELRNNIPITDAKLNLEGNDRVKCLILFGSNPRHCAAVVNAVTKHVYDRENGDMAVGGAFADELIHPSLPDKASKALWGLAFCESKQETEKRIEAASVVIPYNVSEEQEIESYIAKLKGCGLAGKELIGFMMACVGRGSAMHNEIGLESRLFHKHFPSTPLFGIFGGGEIGLDYLPEYECPSKSKRSKATDVDCLHSYSTVFVLVSFL